MVADTRKMYEAKLRIKEMLEVESQIQDSFNAMVEAGALQGKEGLVDFILKRKCPQKVQEIVSMSKENIFKNPYLRDIKIKPVEVNNIILAKRRKIPANTISLYKEPIRSKKSFEQENGYFICDSALHLPCLAEKNTKVCWMSVEPYEIETFRPFIEEATGHVLLCGCGLGYVAYMLSLKEEVQSITIVEIDANIIQVFQEHILPQFSNQNKIKVVKGDALEFLNLFDLNEYDYINVDVWRDTIDMLPFYLQCLEIERQNPEVQFSYWLEPTLCSYIQKHILMAIVDQKDSIDALASKIGEDLVAQVDIQSYEDVIKLVELPNMRGALLRWYKEHLIEFLTLREASKQQTQNMLSALSHNLLRK